MVGEKITLHGSRPCERESGKTNIDSLPDDLLLDILARLSDDPDYLYDKARVVCCRWRHLIQSHDFIKTQLHRSTYGLAISLFLYRSTFFSATEGGIETSEIPYDDGTTHSITQGSCNGLLLQLLQPRGNHMRITNPVTRQQLVLPSFSCAEMICMECGIGYATDSMEYKVVILYMTADELERVSLAILSVGKDKSWRHVGDEPLSLRAMSSLLQLPLVTEGFIIWIDFYGEWYLKLDVETEILTVHPSPVPKTCRVGTRSFYLSTGRSLSLLVVHKHRYPEILALYSHSFDRRSTTIFFNLNTQQISFVELPGRGGAYNFSHVHKKSLAWFT